MSSNMFTCGNYRVLACLHVTFWVWNATYIKLVIYGLCRTCMYCQMKIIACFLFHSNNMVTIVVCLVMLFVIPICAGKALNCVYPVCVALYLCLWNGIFSYPSSWWPPRAWVQGYTVMAYTVMTYAVTSLIQPIQPMWRQRSEGEDPEALSLSLSLHDCVLLLWISSIPLTCRSFMVWSSWQKWAATGFSGFLVLVSGWCRSFWCTAHSPSFRHTVGCTSCAIWDFFYLSWDVVSNVVLTLLSNVSPVTISWQHFYCLDRSIA